jgi:hypothetical protein
MTTLYFIDHRAHGHAMQHWPGLSLSILCSEDNSHSINHWPGRSWSILCIQDNDHYILLATALMATLYNIDKGAHGLFQETLPGSEY